jgi:zinc and cadmium transporter
MIMYPILAAFVIMLASLAGVVFTSRKLGSFMEKNLPFLATFSIGIFAVITWGLFAEALELASATIVILSVAAGMLLIKILSSLMPDAHHHHDPHPSHDHSKLDARRILIGDAVHNITDGLLLVPAFLADFHLGLATTAGILLHELVSEVSEFFIMKEAGYTTKQALLRNLAASATIFIGVFASIYLSSIENLEAPLIGLSAGGFLYVILMDLMPHTVTSVKEKGRGDKHIWAIVLGVLVMLGVSTLTPHAHEEEHEDEGAIFNVEALDLGERP